MNPAAHHWFRHAAQTHKLRLLGIILIAVIGVSLTFWIATTFSAKDFLSNRPLRITKQEQGTYSKVSDAAEEVLKQYPAELGFALNLDGTESRGSVHTLEMLKNGDLDLGLVQGNTDIHGTSGGIVCELYSETFLLFARRPTTNLPSLIGEARNTKRPIRVACLHEGSQSWLDIATIFEFYGLAATEFIRVEAKYGDAIRMLKEKQIDAAFFVTAITHEKLVAMARDPEIVLLSLVGAGSLVTRFRGVETVKIGRDAFGYGIPKEPVESLQTPALLIAGPQVSKVAVSRLASALFRHRWELEKRLPFLSIRFPRTEFAGLIHEGTLIAQSPAAAGWVARHSELLKIILGVPTAVVAMISAFALIRELRREETNKKLAVEHLPSQDGAC